MSAVTRLAPSPTGALHLGNARTFLINWLLARMVRVLYGSPMTDEATCYKLFKREVLQSIPLTCRRFEFCPEVTAKALKRGHKIVEVQATAEQHPFDQAQLKQMMDYATGGIEALIAKQRTILAQLPLRQ